MSVGQHLADVAEEMARRGHRVVVVTARRGYDDPGAVYPVRETMRGVEVLRLPGSSFGKKSFRRRLLAASVFMAQCTALGLAWRDVGAILVSTVPPLGGAAALAARHLRGVPYATWVMDLNPEQLVALGKVEPGDLGARLVDGVNRAILRGASAVFAVDRFMADRLAGKADLDGRLEVLPPWPHEEHLEPVPHDRNPFRERHGLGGRFVFMYSGNHSPSNPVNTFLRASLAFRDDPSVAFLFVGGGQGKAEVERFIAEHRLEGVRSLPYQPLSEIRYSLSAADVHLVSLGEGFVGIVHPCKVYGAMAVARPILFCGPSPSHVADLLDEHRIGWRVAHGDVEGAVRVISEIRGTAPDALAAMGHRAREALRGALSQRVLCGRLCDALERLMR
jgi:glycosyltransferase involved in cell wall biosynthesis